MRNQKIQLEFHCWNWQNSVQLSEKWTTN